MSDLKVLVNEICDDIKSYYEKLGEAVNQIDELQKSTDKLISGKKSSHSTNIRNIAQSFKNTVDDVRTSALDFRKKIKDVRESALNLHKSL